MKELMQIFNTENTAWKDGRYSLFLGQPLALHDTINMNYPSIDKITRKQITNRWQFDEFNHDQSRMDLLSCPRSVYQVMLMNLAFQWEADSLASRAIAPAFAPFVTNSEFWEGLLENTLMEVTHTKTYSEIVRTCVPDPSEVFKMVMENQETLLRCDTMNKAFSSLIKLGAAYTLGQVENNQETYNAVFKGMFALYLLERLQFMSSFAATFAIVEQGYFQSIGKAVQKIMVDEVDCHAALDLEALKIELRTERGRIALAACLADMQAMLDEVVAREIWWGLYLFSQGRSIVGLNPTLLKEWVLFNAQVIYAEFGLVNPYAIIAHNPLPWMANWIDIDKHQNAQQEAAGNNYALNVVKDDLGSEELDF
jgi:ribonucleoside-diphosphate reductase beta chain